MGEVKLWSAQQLNFRHFKIPNGFREDDMETNLTFISKFLEDYQQLYKNHIRGMGNNYFSRKEFIRMFNSVSIFIHNYVIVPLSHYQDRIPNITLTTSYQDFQEVIDALKDHRNNLDIQQIIKREGSVEHGHKLEHHFTHNFLNIADNTSGIRDEMQLFLIMKYRLALVKVGLHLKRLLPSPVPRGFSTLSDSKKDSSNHF
jgi:hypothetical protein